MTLCEKMEELMDNCPGLGWTDAMCIIFENYDIKEIEECNSEQQMKN